MQQAHLFKASTVPHTTLRRLRVMPSYFFLIWRWSMWLYAFSVIMFSFQPQNRSNVPFVADPQHLTYEHTAILLLTITFIETLIVTLYAPVIQFLVPRLMRKPWFDRETIKQRNGRAEILPPLTPTRNRYWDIAIYGMDVLICGLVMYYSGPFSNPPFGLGSPFYRYGMSTVFAAAIAYRYKGGLLAAFVYSSFALLGLLVPAPGATPYQLHTLVDIAGSMVDTPIAAILVAYLATLLDNYAQSKRREQENARTQQYLVRVGETLLKNTRSVQELLESSIVPMQKGGYFDRLVIALVTTSQEEDEHTQQTLHIGTFVEAHTPEMTLADSSKALAEQVLQTGQKYQTFEPLTKGYGISRLYIPFRKDGQIQLIIGAECQRTTPFTPKHETFLAIAGNELLVALENVRLAEQTVQLAAAAERGRIAREIHDGIAQLTYMLSLQSETCYTQARRIEEASEEDAELIKPLADRLEKMVTISKQALWETRNYMFSIKPLMSGTTTLSEMLSNQLREFEAISDLSTQFICEGEDDIVQRGNFKSKHFTQVGAALSRIVQEALTNTYKHAQATHICVTLRYSTEAIQVNISDNGRGLPQLATTQATATSQIAQPRFYSGHGLQGMYERAAELGGTVSMSANPTGGVTVHVDMPTGIKGENNG